MPRDWQAVTYCFEIIDDDVWEESALVKLDGQGEKSVSLRRSKGTMLDAFIELARRMDESSHEEWRKALFSMTPDGKFAINFVYRDH